jgi:hypothetical protein
MLTVGNGGTGGAVSATLTGTGLSAAAVTLTPTALNFANTNVVATSAVQNIVVANTGSVSATLGTAQITGDFNITFNNCGTSLNAQSSCTVSIVFVPTASGTRTGTFQISSGSSTLTASLVGFGLSPPTDTLNLLSLTFAAQQVGTVNAAPTITVTNTGNSSLIGVTAQITSGDFTLVSGCGASLAGNSSCGVNVMYAPKNIGMETGTLTIADALRTQTVALNGTGLAAAGVSLSPLGGINYGVVGVGQSSAAQTVILSNNGGTPLNISNFTIIGAGDFVIPAGSNNCPVSLSTGSICSLQIVFAPLNAGMRTSQLTVSDNAGNSPQTLALSGMGLDFAFGTIGSTSQTVTSGQPASYSLTLTPAVAGLSNALSFACAGVPSLPAYTTCTVSTSPTTATLAGNAAVTVYVATGVNTSTLTGAVVLPSRTGKTTLVFAFLPAAWMVFLFRRCKGRAKWHGALLQIMLWIPLALVIFGAQGCSSGRLIPTSTTGGTGGSVYTTPSGTYALNLSDTSGGVTHTQALTLIVH